MNTLKIAFLTICLISFVTNVYSQKKQDDKELAKKYYNKAIDLINVNNFSEALLYSEKTQELYIKLYGEKSLKNADCYNLYGYIYFYSEDYQKAEENWLKCIEIRKELLGEKSKDVADVYNSLGANFNSKSEFIKAIECYNKSLEINIALFGEKSTGVALCYTNLGNAYKNISDYKKALEYYNKSLILKEELFGNQSESVANTLNNIGNLYLSIPDYSKSLDFHYKSLEIRKKIFGENSLDAASSYNNIGIVYRHLSDYNAALWYFTKSSDIFLKSGRINISLAKNYDNIGNVYLNKTEFSKALIFYFKALKIKLDILGEKSLEVATSYNNIGIVYSDILEYDKSLEFFFKSIEIKIKILGTNSMEVAETYNNIGSVYEELNEIDIALEYYFKSLEIINIFFDDNSNLHATIYNNLGNLYNKKSEIDKALEYHIKSLNIKRNNVGEISSDVAFSYNNIANIYFDKNDFTKALEYYKKSLNIRKILVGEKSSDIATTSKNIGVAYLYLSDYKNAIFYFQKAIASSLYDFHDTLNPLSIPKIENYNNWSILSNCLYYKSIVILGAKDLFPEITDFERYTILLNNLLACDTLIRQVRNNISSQKDKLLLNQLTNKIYKLAIEICFKLSNNFSDLSTSQIKNFQNLAFNLSEKNKASILMQSISQGKALKYSGIPDSLINKEQSLKNDIASYINLHNSANSDSIANIWKSRLFNANRSYDSLISYFEKNYPNYYNLKYNQNYISPAEISKLLNKNEAMLSYTLTDTSLLTFFITKKEFKTFVVRVPDSLDLKIDFYRQSLSNLYLISKDKENNTNKTINYFLKEGYRLYQILFPQEIQNELEKNKISNLIIIPDGHLTRLPFETLLTNNYQQENWNGWDNVQYFSEIPYLIKKYNVSYNYSASLYKEMSEKQKNKTRQAKYDWIGFAPVFEDEKISGNIYKSQRIVEMENQDRFDSISRQIFNGMYIRAIPGTKDEVLSIFDLYNTKKKSAKVLTYQQANETAIKLAEIKDYKIIHLATHGAINEMFPELSAILLSQDSTQKTDSLNVLIGDVAQQNEGFLYESEIYNLNLNASLVVLSACETGLGKISAGEGVIGISRAMIYAGADNLIVSLWAVNDIATKYLMIAFYNDLLKNKNQKKYSKSLRFAKLEMIKQGLIPYFWSPFILIGN